MVLSFSKLVLAACAGALLWAGIDAATRSWRSPAPEANGMAAALQRVPRPAVALQPLAQQARRADTALSYLGQPLAREDRQALDAAISLTDEAEATERIQTTLDKYAIAVVRINPESRVSVEQGPAKPELVKAGTRLFLVKVYDHARDTYKRLIAESPEQ